MAAGVERRRVADDLSGRDDGRGGGHGATHEAGPIAGRLADRHGAGGHRAGRGRPSTHADGVPHTGGSGLHRAETRSHAGKAPGGQGICGVVLERHRLGAVFFQRPGHRAGRLEEDQAVRDGGQPRAGGPLPLGAPEPGSAGNGGHFAQFADRPDQRRSPAAELRAGRTGGPGSAEHARSGLGAAGGGARCHQENLGCHCAGNPRRDAPGGGRGRGADQGGRPARKRGIGGSDAQTRVDRQPVDGRRPRPNGGARWRRYISKSGDPLCRRTFSTR